MVTFKPRIFIGSAGGAKDIVHALHEVLSVKAAPIAWYHDDTIAASKTVIERLDKIAHSEVDGAVLVLTVDDLRKRDGSQSWTPRDNVIFELGLFIGSVGRDRTFGLLCSHCAKKLTLPSDLFGVTWVEYQDPRCNGASPTGDTVAYLNQLATAVRPAADRILKGLEAAKVSPVRAPGLPDLVKAYPMRGSVPRHTWNEVLQNASQHVWLYGMAEHGYADDDEVPELLTSAARRGCEIRVLLLDPEHSGTLMVDREEGNPSGTIAPRIRAALARFQVMAEACGGNMRVHVYDGPPTVSIVRGDDRILVTPYVRYISGDNTPTFELESAESNGMFVRYARHFRKVWDESRPWKG
ncbi:TIR domain-containing protein [Streptomyces pseudogriseolus]|uniref:TIR domain-containing protein n=1 Tax=Streptomyces pseudogriseolus TaxID=36817 RepID=UPI003FA274AE